MDCNAEEGSMPDKTVGQKLLIKECYKVLVVNAPDAYGALLGPLPPQVVVLKRAEAGTDLIQVFIKSRKEMELHLPVLKTALKRGGLLWVTYPRGTSGTPADIKRDTISACARTIGMVGVAMISVDSNWSALRLKTA
jgi:hypothetical protein